MDVKLDDIRVLLDRFYQGDTSQAEERVLTEFFVSATDLPEDMEADRKLFSALASAETVTHIPSDLDAKILEAIERSSNIRDAKIPEDIKGNGSSRKWIRRIISFTAAAAVLIIAFLPLRHYIVHADTQSSDLAGQTNKEISQEELQALETGLLALDKAAQKLAYAYDCIEESDSKVTNACKNIDKILNENR